jgi:hypothetical protein
MQYTRSVQYIICRIYCTAGVCSVQYAIHTQDAVCRMQYAIHTQCAACNMQDTLHVRSMQCAVSDYLTYNNYCQAVGNGNKLCRLVIELCASVLC